MERIDFKNENSILSEKETKCSTVYLVCYPRCKKVREIKHHHLLTTATKTQEGKTETESLVTYSTRVGRGGGKD